MSIAEPLNDTRMAAYVIEDDEALGSALTWMLEGAGFASSHHVNAKEFLEQLNISRACVVVTDIRMRGMTGLELQGVLAKRHPEIPVILITAHGDLPMAVEAVKSGAFDFIEKPFENMKLLRVVRIAESHALRSFEDRQTLDAANAIIGQLSPREHEVFELVSCGHSNKIIAARLDVVIKTVEAHRSKMMEKLGAKNLADVVALSKKAHIAG